MASLDRRAFVARLAALIAAPVVAMKVAAQERKWPRDETWKRASGDALSEAFIGSRSSAIYDGEYNGEYNFIRHDRPLHIVMTWDGATQRVWMNGRSSA
jgi:lipocalin